MTDVSVTLRPPCLCPSEGHKHGVSIQSSINFGDTFLQIMREWKAAETWFLARLFIYQSSIVWQTLDFFHWMVTIFIFITWLMKTENWPSFFGQDGWILDMDRDSVSVHKRPKKNLANIQPSWTKKLGQLKICYLAFSRGTRRVVPSGQDSCTLPARVANHSARFGSSFPLKLRSKPYDNVS